MGDFPDNETAAAFTLAVNASGAVKIKTTVLMTPEEVDEATRKTVNYRPPGK
ncbi:MAG: GYD domain-containing protein [Desulforhopalus sp.]